MCNISTDGGGVGRGRECGGNTFTICQKEIIAAVLSGAGTSSSYNMITPQSGRLSSPCLHTPAIAAIAVYLENTLFLA